jgi:hypothetical protein
MHPQFVVANGVVYLFVGNNADLQFVLSFSMEFRLLRLRCPKHSKVDATIVRGGVIDYGILLRGNKQ